MLKVMHDVCDEASKNVVKFKETLQVCYIHQVVHTLKRVNDMCLIMVWVIMEVAVRHLNNILKCENALRHL